MNEEKKKRKKHNNNNFFVYLVLKIKKEFNVNF